VAGGETCCQISQRVLLANSADKTKDLENTRRRNSWKLLKIKWSHPPGLNRRPADYETTRIPQLLDSTAPLSTPRAPAERTAALVEQDSEQVAAPRAPSNTTAATVEQVARGGGASAWRSTAKRQSAVRLSLTVTHPSGPTESGLQSVLPGTQRASSDEVDSLRHVPWDIWAGASGIACRVVSIWIAWLSRGAC